jgi:tetratricopeptide (TPR) repeat protein
LAPSRQGFRAVNVAAHAATTLALFALLLILASPEAAWLGAALFAVHPLGSEAVLWAVGRAEIFAALLGLVAFATFVRLQDREGLGGYRLALSVAAFFAGLCFKESAAAWLAIALAWTAFGQAGDRRWTRRELARAGIYAGAFAAFLLLRASVVGWGRQAAPFVDNPLAAADGATRIVNATLLFARYISKMIWPATLSVDYGFNQISVVPLLPWGAAAAAAVVAGMAFIAIGLFRKGQKLAAFLVALLPCAFAVTGNFLFPIGTIFAERLAYTPLLGFCGLAGVGLAMIPNAPARRIAAAVLIVACGARTIARGRDYADLKTFNEATVEASPNAVKALVNAARTRLRLGDAAGARPLLEHAVAVWPDYQRAWHLLAESCDALGDGAHAAEARRGESRAAGRGAGGDEPL